ncbi:MAG: hypothetical protein H7Y42_07975 [Chitinophagaceae bacterium]|nr:hypothetical protein [Chitinophagaceae bacterium]
MRKYLSGIIVVVLAIGAMAFSSIEKKPFAIQHWYFHGDVTDDLYDAGNYVKDVPPAGSCGTGDPLPCLVDVDIVASNPTAGQFVSFAAFLDAMEGDPEEFENYIQTTKE